MLKLKPIHLLIATILLLVIVACGPAATLTPAATLAASTSDMASLQTGDPFVETVAKDDLASSTDIPLTVNNGGAMQLPSINGHAYSFKGGTDKNLTISYTGADTHTHTFTIYPTPRDTDPRDWDIVHDNGETMQVKVNADQLLNIGLKDSFNLRLRPPTGTNTHWQLVGEVNVAVASTDATP